MLHLLFDPVVVASACDLLLAALVLNANPRRPANVSFVVMAVCIAAWLTTRQIAFASVADKQMAAFWIRTCSTLGLFVPLAGALLRSAITYQDQGWLIILRRLTLWLSIAASVAVLCWTPFYLYDVTLPFVGASASTRFQIPRPVYGWAVFVLITYLIGSGIALVYLVWLDRRQRLVVGALATELQYMQLGYVVLLAGAIVSAWHPRYSALGTLAYVTIIAYGITTRSILDVRTFMRRVLSYCVLFAYACTVFAVVWAASGWLLGQFGTSREVVEYWPPLLGAFAVALLVTPSRSGFQRLARRISPPRDLDFEKTVTRIEEIIQTFTGRRALLEGFCRTLREEANTDAVTILVVNDQGGFRQVYPPPIENHFITLGPEDPLIQAFQPPNVPEVALEHLERRAPEPVRNALLHRLRELKSDATVAVRRRGQLSALIMMGQRHGGRIFGRTGLAVLRVLADQLAVALDNCRLYTEAKRTAAYVQVLVENLSVGVIAADESQSLTVFNRQAERLLKLSRTEARTATDLPPAPAQFICLTLAERATTHDEPLTLRPDTREQADLLVSSLPFTFEDEDENWGRPSAGAILVLTDRTALLRLERQVHQSERLASIGTLAAGMAHEIKNPLVSLRVFTQLLPKRFMDPEFRESFHELVGGEIVRIENIVNQMLDFARPTKPALAPMRLHDVIHTVRRFVEPQVARNGIELRTELLAENDGLTGDRAKLQQVLLNLLINALEAFPAPADGAKPPPGRRVEISTRLERGFPGDPNDPNCPPVLVTDVRDNGPGIPAEMLPHLFDPFFTTKANGTGLGLSVSHTIVRDHGGFVEVYSEPGRGTRFSIRLPVSPPLETSAEAGGDGIFPSENALLPAPESLETDAVATAVTLR